MAPVNTRREVYAESTRRALLESGICFFTDPGYVEVSAEELVRAAGLSRGALYHHFDGKRGLFEAVFEELEQRAAQRITDALDSSGDLWERTVAGLAAFLDVCVDDNYRKIVILQGPAVLGRERWRDLDSQYLGGLILNQVRALNEAGLISDHPAGLVAASFYGSLTEISFVLASVNDATEGREHAARLVETLLASLRPR
ncbi:TetR/AcrR family transcriptional regulator [Streptomyces sp. NPDC002285]